MARRLINWPSNDKRLTLELFKVLYSEFRVLFPLKQPIPDFSSLNKESLGKLESALGAVSFETKDGSRFKEGVETAAAYLYFINKSHFLFNGNKRASLYAFFGYLRLNNHFIETGWEDVYKIAEKIAQSKSREEIWDTIINFVDQNICEFNSQLKVNLVTAANEWTNSNPETI